MRPAALAALLLCGCSAAPIVAVKPGYDFSKTGRVALLNLQDAPEQPGSGAVVSESLEPHLLKAGYDLVERGQVGKLLRERDFSRSEAVDPADAQAVGKLLGVKAVILGRVTSAVQARSSIYMQNVQNTRYNPVYQPVERRGRDGKTRVRRELSHYDVVTTNDQIPQTYTTAASVAFTARLVDVATGQVLWTGSSSSEGDSLAAAANDAGERLLGALKKAWPAPR